jgi:hypothetical protein
MPIGQLVACNKKIKKMKKYLLLFVLVSGFSFAQETQKEYAKLSKEELITKINSKDKEIKSLQEKLKSEKKAEVAPKQNNAENSKIAEFKKSIKETNAVFLKEIFDNKYVNKPYLTDTDLAVDDISTRIENSNVLIRSILLDDTNREVFDIGNKALAFNTNYLKLFEIRKNVLGQKYDAVKVEEALKEIEKLPALEVNSKLGNTKTNMSNFLKNYLENTCLLKKTLEAYKKADQSAIIKQKYTALEKDERYKDYPYLIETIRKIKNNVNNYTNDDLQPCEFKVDASLKTNNPAKLTEPEGKK